MRALDREREEIGMIPYPLWIEGSLYHVTRCRGREDGSQDLVTVGGFLVSPVTREEFYHIISRSYLDHDTKNYIRNHVAASYIESVDNIISYMLTYIDSDKNHRNDLSYIFSMMTDSKNSVNHFLDGSINGESLIAKQKYIVCRNDDPPFYHGLISLNGRPGDQVRVWEAALAGLREEARQLGSVAFLFRFDLVNKEIYLGDSGIVLYHDGANIKARLFGRMNKGTVKNGVLASCNRSRRDGYRLADREEVWRVLGQGLTETSLGRLVRAILALWQDPHRTISAGQIQVELPVSLTCRSEGGADEKIIRDYNELVTVIDRVRNRDKYFQFLSKADDDDVSPYVCYLRQCRKGVQLWPKNLEENTSLLLHAAFVVGPIDQGEENNQSGIGHLLFRDWQTTTPCDELGE